MNKWINYWFDFVFLKLGLYCTIMFWFTPSIDLIIIQAEIKQGINIYI